MRPSVVVRTIDRDHVVATWDCVLIQVWRGPITRLAVTDLNVVTKKFMKESGVRISSLSIVEPTSPPPEDDLRKALSTFYRQNAAKMDHQIIVPEGGGFRSALVRGVGIALSRLAPQSIPLNFVATVPDAAVRIAPHLSSRAGGSVGLLEAVDSVREHLQNQSRV